MSRTGTISPMFSASSRLWNAMPTTFPSKNTGPPLFAVVDGRIHGHRQQAPVGVGVALDLHP